MPDRLPVVLGIAYVVAGVAVAECWRSCGRPAYRRGPIAYIMWLTVWPVMVAIMLLVEWEDWREWRTERDDPGQDVDDDQSGR